METVATRGLSLQQAQPPPPGYGPPEAQRSPYEHAPPPGEDAYVRSYAQMNELSGLARPVVSYSSDMATRAYEGHRPYEGGAFDRYEPPGGSSSGGSSSSSGANCGIQQRSAYPSYMTPLEETDRYQEHASSAVPPTPILKPEHSEGEQNTGPIYPR